MNQRSWVCPQCRRLSGAAERRCDHCGTFRSGPHLWVQAAFSAPAAATRFLVGLCVLDFAVMVLLNGGLPIGLFGPHAKTAAVIGAGGVSGLWAAQEPWRLLSATFVHLSLLHLGMNMMALVSFGRAFEERFKGPRLIVVYALTGCAGFWFSGLFYGPYGPLTAGASGAIFGLIGVQIGALISRRDPAVKDVFFQYLVMAVAFALVFPVNNFAHLGGFVTGVPLGALLDRERSSPGRDKTMTLLSLLVAVLAVCSIALCLVSLYALRSESETRASESNALATWLSGNE